MEAQSIKSLALKIAAILPEERAVALAVLGLVEDLLEWRGYSEEAAANASANLTGTDEVSPQ